MILDERLNLKEKVQQDLEEDKVYYKMPKAWQMGSWDLDVVSNEINFSDALYKILGYKPTLFLQV
jgi:hypothetical protein